MTIKTIQTDAGQEVKAMAEIKQVDMGKVCQEAKKAIEHLYTLKRNERKGFDWKGPDIQLPEIISVRHDAKTSLNEKMVQFDEKEQNRSALDIVLGVVFMMGYQNGAVKNNKDMKLLMQNLNDYMKLYKEEKAKNEKK